MRASLVLVLLGSVLAFSACTARPTARGARPSEAATTSAPSATLPPAPPDVFATAPVGADGVPVLVQREVDRFAGEHVPLKPEADLPAPADAPVKLKSWAAADGTRYTFNGRGVFISCFPGPPGPSIPAGDGKLPDPQLIAKARAYVGRHFDQRQAAWPATVTRRVEGIDQHGKAHYEISVELRELVGRVPSPNFIRLHVDLAGDVLDFTRDDGPVDLASSSPRVSKDQAVAIVRKKLAEAGWELQRSDLVAKRDPSGRVRLVWDLQLDWRPKLPPNVQGSAAAAWATVDAITGEIVSLAR